MSQYKTGVANVTNGSATVTGSGTLWSANVSAADSFTIAGDGVMYDVASVDSDTQVTLSVAYAGVTAAGAVYAIGTSFTVPDSFPEMSQGDIETATIFTRAMRGIQSRFTGIAINTTAEIGQAVNDHVALPDPHAQYLKESEYEAHRSREDLLKQATLSLDFANNKYEVYEGPVNSLTQMPFNTALDFTRGTTATARNAIGGITDVAIDDQRLVGNREGLLIEEQRTNLITYSEEFDNADWSTTGGTIVVNDAVAPDGAATADKLVSGNGVDAYRVTQTLSLTSGKQYTLGFFVDAAGFDFVQIFLGNAYASAGSFVNFDISTGTKGDLNGSITRADIELLGSYYRCSVTFTAEATATGSSGLALVDGIVAGYAPVSTGDGTSGVYIWGAQVEEGSFPTSYIPTAGTQVTRAADDCVRVLGDEYNQDEGTIYLEIPSGARNSAIPRLLFFKPINISDFNEVFGFNISLAGYSFAGQSAGNSTISSPIDAGSDSVIKLAASYKIGGDYVFAVNGQTTSGSWLTVAPLVKEIGIGNRENGHPNIAIKDLKVFPTALSEAELITLTGGTY